MHVIRGVILDVDGTLVDSNDAHARAWVEAMAEFGVLVPFEEVRLRIGKGGDKLLPEVTGIPEESPRGKELSRRKGEIFESKYLPHLDPFPRTKGLLERIRAAGLVLAVASSAGRKDLKSLLKVAGVTDLVEVKVSKDDAGRSKPDPDIVKAALHKTKLDPGQAVMIGDTPYDLVAAIKAGVATIAFRCGGWNDEDFPGAIAVYDGPADLLERFDSSPLAGDHALPELLRDREHPRPTWQRVLLLMGAAVMFVLGIVGWLVPVVTGVPFYIVGLVFLAMASTRFRDWVNRLERKLTPLHRFKVRRMLHRLPSERMRHAILFPEDLGGSDAAPATSRSTESGGKTPRGLEAK